MPVAPFSTYRPPPLFANGHLLTIFPNLFRRVPGVRYERERLRTPDGDVLELDWLRTGSRRLAVVTHGLEGDSRRGYVLGMARALETRGWDVLAWNFRGCGGEPNRRLRFYHSGDTADLEAVLDHALRGEEYAGLALVGFSIGGNVTLKYLGERGAELDPRVRGAVAFSVPCDLAPASRQLARRSNTVYMERFLRTLRAKIREKARRFPGEVDARGAWRIRDFRGFDERYTAPMHGFAGADDYWERASSRPWLGRIRVPALLVNAADDPFLAPECFPFEEAHSSRHLLLEVPPSGGHVGFVTFGQGGEYWSEARAASFLGTAVSGD